MYNIAIEEWLNEVGDPNVNPSGGPPQVGLGVPPAQEQPTTNNAPDPNAPPPNTVNVDKDSPTQGKGIEKDTKIPDVSQDPQSPDMPKEEKDMAFIENIETDASSKKRFSGCFFLVSSYRKPSPPPPILPRVDWIRRSRIFRSFY